MTHEAVTTDEPDGPNEVCSIQRSLDVLGQKWAFLIVRNALRGTTKFSDFRRELGIPTDMLSARLAALVDAGIFERESYRETGSRTRYAYLLTRRGQELKVVLAALQQWGEANRPAPGVPATYIQERGGGNVHVVMVNDKEDVLHIDDVRLVSAELAQRIRSTR
ncbi:winged helix-turn-helix transcriptional regulator [Streptomyces sp. NPDC051217]|uniref:winged helix-turn-helix transcriptional regulator n=1 Tax=Streptomyces sp. NPDC051217 TaxID=3365644 RepID=UPI0037A61562